MIKTTKTVALDNSEKAPEIIAAHFLKRFSKARGRLTVTGRPFYGAKEGAGVLIVIGRDSHTMSTDLALATAQKLAAKLPPISPIPDAGSVNLRRFVGLLTSTADKANEMKEAAKS